MIHTFLHLDIGVFENVPLVDCPGDLMDVWLLTMFQILRHSIQPRVELYYLVFCVLQLWSFPFPLPWLCMAGTQL